MNKQESIRMKEMIDLLHKLIVETHERVLKNRPGEEGLLLRLSDLKDFNTDNLTMPEVHAIYIMIGVALQGIEEYVKTAETLRILDDLLEGVRPKQTESFNFFTQPGEPQEDNDDDQ